MKRTSVQLALILFLFSFFPNISLSATPFSTPADFDLTGSEIGLSLSFETATVGNVSASVSPNPAPVTGIIQVTQLNQISGAFSGAFQDITVSTTASVPQLDLSIPITITLNCNPVSGWFLWSQDAVIFDAETISATITFGGQTYVLPFDGLYFPANYQNSILSVDTQLAYSGEYMGRSYALTMVVNLVGTLDTLEPSSESKPWIDLKTDKQEYQNGNSLTLSISAGGTKPAQPMDVYVALIAPDGTIYFAPTYTTTMTPMLSNFQPQNDFYYAPFTFLTATLPCSAPPIAGDGTYYFAAAFAEAGTTHMLSDIEMTPFVYQDTPALPPGHSTDGTWSGNGVNEAANGECADLAWVTMEIKDGSITGEAGEDVAVDADGYELTGTIKQNGEIIDGILWEEFGASLIKMGVFTGQVSGSTIQGSWHDSYGCYGTFTVSKMEQ